MKGTRKSDPESWDDWRPHEQVAENARLAAKSKWWKTLAGVVLVLLAIIGLGAILRYLGLTL